VALIELDRANVIFPIVRDKGLTFKEFIISLLGGKRKTRITEIHALRDVSLSLKDGTRLGIIGHNGAGKSTLLRTMAGIYPVDSGRCHIQGHICSLFDITLGFEREATGWDNIRYRAYLQGETPQSLEGKIADIAKFSELGEFLDVPIKCYSAGMVMRLAFAIATANAPEILLIDEVFGTGDLAFRTKAKERITQMMDSAKIIVMVGHDLASIESFCDTVVWMEHGQVRQIGPSREVLAGYQQSACQYISAEVIARYQGPGDFNMYMARLIDVSGGVQAQIAKNVNGKWQVLAWNQISKRSGRLRFDAMGTSLKLYLDNVLLAECVDGSLSHGSVGIRAMLPEASFERFSARAVTHDDNRRIHPLSGSLLGGSWRHHIGNFTKDSDRWSPEKAELTLSTLSDVDSTDVSVSCDIDLGARDAVRTAA